MLKKVSNFIEYKQLDSGLLVPSEYKSYPTGFDFFAGIGGFSLGFIQAGFEVVGALEISPEAAHTYMTNLCSHPVQIHYTSDKYRVILEKHFDKAFKKHLKENRKVLYKGAHQRNNNLLESDNIFLSDFVSGSGWIQSEREAGKFYPPVKNFFFGDIREVSGEWILERLGMAKGELDAVMGGPPCQGFSRANNQRRPSDPRNNLVFEFGRMVVELQPKTFIMEEVPDIVDFVTPEGIPVLDGLCIILEDGGFGRFEALRNSILATAGIGLTKKGAGFRTKNMKDLKSKKDKITDKKRDEIRKAVYKKQDNQYSIF